MEERYVYKDLNEVPVKWRSYKGARLSLEQVNLIMEYAYDNMMELEDGTFIPAYGQARIYFEEMFYIENGIWISN